MKVDFYNANNAQISFAEDDISSLHKNATLIAHKTFKFSQPYFLTGWSPSVQIWPTDVKRQEMFNSHVHLALLDPNICISFAAIVVCISFRKAIHCAKRLIRLEHTTYFRMVPSNVF